MQQLEAIRFPFIGALEDGESFEYLLFQLTPDSVKIAICNWMVNHTFLGKGEKINLFIPQQLTPHPMNINTPGVVNEIQKESNGEATYYEIGLQKELKLKFVGGAEDLAKNIQAAFSLKDLLVRLIKDSLILKQGIIVYMKHLTPYFSRITESNPENFKNLEIYIFDDIKNKIKNNVEDLFKLHEKLKDMESSDEIPVYLDLETLRQNFESEISVELFLFSFADSNSQNEMLELLKYSEYQDKLRIKYAHLNYLISIKELEKKLFLIYNEIVLIYLKSI